MRIVLFDWRVWFIMKARKFGWLSSGCEPWLAAVLVALALASCSTERPLLRASDESVIAERAAARWSAMIERDFDTAYRYTTPAYRETHPVRLFRGRFGSQVAWTAARVENVTVDGDVARVRIWIVYQAVDPSGQPFENERPIEEVWIRAGGDWWHKME